MRFVVVFFALFICHFAFSQNDSIVVKDTSHSIKKAVLFSAFIPASGQVYNHMHFAPKAKGRNNVYWKVPLFYGVLGFALNNLIQNQNTQKTLKEEYYYRLDNNSNLYSEYANYDLTGIVSLTKDYESKRDQAILLLGAAYFIQVLDAGIEAHFVDFDVSEDLTLQFRPKLLNISTLGFGVNLKFN